jgi:hypothetical protein
MTWAALAGALGRFVGAMLAECAPVIVGIIKEALHDTVEDGAARDDLRSRLLDRLRHSDSARAAGGTGEAPADDPERPSLGG